MPARPALAPLPALAAVMGTAYLIGDPPRTSGASFSAAKAVMPMPWWGVLFLTGAVALTVTLAARWRTPLAVALFIGGGIYTWWAACHALAAATYPGASAAAWAIHATIAYAHFYAAARVWGDRA